MGAVTNLHPAGAYTSLARPPKRDSGSRFPGIGLAFRGVHSRKGTVMDTEQRILALERQVKRFRILCGVAVVGALAAVLVGADEPEVSTLHAPLRVVDKTGAPVFVVDSENGKTDAYLYGAKGKRMTILSASADGSGLVVSGSAKTDEPDITLVAMPTGSALLMNGPKGKKGVEIAASAEGGDVSSYDAKGEAKE